MNTKLAFAFGLGVGLAFSLGFAAALALTTPHASAQSARPRYEYLRMDHGWDGGRWAREAGQEGWEMFQFEQDPRANDRGMYFRRVAQ